MFQSNRRLVLGTTLVLGAGALAAVCAGIHWSMRVFLG
jgi:hypothetical protein